MRSFSTLRGSIIAEAAVIMPVVIITITAMFCIGIKKVYAVRTLIYERHCNSAKIIFPSVSPEAILRLKKLGIEILWED